MWESGNRRALVLLTALCLLVILYKAWGLLLLITVALVLVISTCYSLLVNDTLLSPFTLVCLAYIRAFGIELFYTLKILCQATIERVSETTEIIKNYFGDSQEDQQQLLAMNTNLNGNRRAGQIYRLSSDPFSDQQQPSPIVRAPFHMYHSATINGRAMVGHESGLRTSTPLTAGWRKDLAPNGTIDLFPSTSSKKVSPIGRSENRQPSITRSDETMYSAKDSPWSPKVGGRSMGMRSPSVQTIAGPLLNSSRYNIDPK